MQIYDFEKNRKKIKTELQLRLIKREEKIKIINKDYRQNNNYDENKFYKNKDEIFDMENLEQIFICVENKTIGTKSLDSKHIYKNISNKKIDYSKFINCDFNNIKFENCTFLGSNFKNCRFNNVYFSHCSFEDEEKISTVFENSCIFKDCTFYKNNMKNTVFNLTIFNDVKCILTSLRNAIINECNMENITFVDCDLKSMKTINTNINILNF